jgi:hypothetical protein
LSLLLVLIPPCLSLSLLVSPPCPVSSLLIPPRPSSSLLVTPRPSLLMFYIATQYTSVDENLFMGFRVERG